MFSALTLPDDKMETSSPFQAEPTSKSDPPKKRGGNSSKQRRDKFRHKKNDEARKVHKTKLNQSLQPHLAEMFQQFEHAQQSGNTITIPLPITTRGIGIHMAKLYDYADHGLQNTYPMRCSIHAAYRIALMQFKRQLFRVPRGQPQHPGIDIDDAVSSIKVFEDRNYTLICDAINQCGLFEHNGVHYRPYVPKLQKRQFTFDEPDDVEYVPTSPDPLEPSTFTPQKRKRITVDTTVPDPYHVTIDNLRQTCELMSSPATPVQVREDFIRRNPIPGANYHNNLLMNRDDIMPEHYFRGNFIELDIAAFRTFCDRMASSNSCQIGKVNMDGKGSELLLTTVSTDMLEQFKLVDRTLMLTNISTTTASCVMSPIARARGFVGLMNEAPLLPHSRTTLPSSFALRTSYAACFVNMVRWSQLASGLDPITHAD